MRQPEVHGRTDEQAYPPYNIEKVGEDRAAMDAYRRAAASTGLMIPDQSSVRL